MIENRVKKITAFLCHFNNVKYKSVAKIEPQFPDDKLSNNNVKC